MRTIAGSVGPAGTRRQTAEKEVELVHEDHPHHSDIFPAHSPEYTDPSIPRRAFAPYGPYPERVTNRVSLAAFAVTVFNMVVGTLSLILTGPYFSLLVSLTGIVLGHVALYQLRTPTHRPESGRLIAVCCLVLNYSALLFVAGITVLLLVTSGIGRVILGL